MGSSFRNYRQSLVPTTHQRAAGQALQGQLGDVNDSLVDRAKQAVKARMPLVAPTDALAALGVERGFLRGPGESDAAYGARLQAAWNTWPWAGTAFGVLSALYATGYTNVFLAQVRGGYQYTLDVTGTTLVRTTSGSWTPTWTTDTFWSRFDVLFPAPLKASWQSGGVPAANSNEANLIRAIIRTWRPAAATCNRIVIVTSGKSWGYPSTQVWGAATGNWGSSTTVAWTP